MAEHIYEESSFADCPSCGKEFNPWSSKDKGKDQKYPYKKCFSCKQGPQAQEGSPKPTEDMALLNQRLTSMGKFLMDELQDIKDKLAKIEDLIYKGGLK